MASPTSMSCGVGLHGSCNGKREKGAGVCTCMCHGSQEIQVSKRIEALAIKMALEGFPSYMRFDWEGNTTKFRNAWRRKAIDADKDAAKGPVSLYREESRRIMGQQRAKRSRAYEERKKRQKWKK